MTTTVKTKTSVATITLFGGALDNPRGKRRDLKWSRLFYEFSNPIEYTGSVPGWSPAVFTGDHRAQESVEKSGAVVFDYDGIKSHDGITEQRTTIDDAVRIWDRVYGCLHTTKRHTAEKHRFRVILPLSRAVSGEEMALINWLLAKRAGHIDRCGLDIARRWEMPSRQDGVDYECIPLAGKLLNADSLVRLARARKAVADQLESEARAARLASLDSGDGANALKRASAYIARIEPAISGSGGHSTLFRVVRKCVDGFGLSDDEAMDLIIAEYNPRCQPPWKSKEIWHKIQQARKHSGDLARPVEGRTYEHEFECNDDDTETRGVPVTDTGVLSGAQQAKINAPAMVVATQPSGGDVTIPWRLGLTYNDKGTLTKDVGNAALIIAHDDRFHNALAYDSFADEIKWKSDPPKLAGFVPPRSGEPLRDNHVVYIGQWLSKTYGTSFPRQSLWDAVDAAAKIHEYHPLRDYLDELEWDGNLRVDSWLTDYLGVESTPYAAMVGRWWLISAIARAYAPGCQVDHALILEGPQGSGKSTALAALGGDWYLGSMPDIRDRDRAAGVLQGHWIVEIGELDAIRGAEATRIKDFLSQGDDVYRAAYARTSCRRPRTCVFAGTTNEKSYLSDPTGARRFWPVACGRIDREALLRDRGQLWAEARANWRQGGDAGRYWPIATQAHILAEQQSARREVDSWESLIAGYMRTAIRPTLDDIFTDALGIERRSDWTRSSQMRIGKIMVELGYGKQRKMVDGVRTHYYVREPK